MEYTAKNLSEVADYLATLASDQRASISFQSTKKAKAECLTAAKAYDDAAFIVRNTKLTG